VRACISLRLHYTMITITFAYYVWPNQNCCIIDQDGSMYEIVEYVEVLGLLLRYRLCFYVPKA
jgi:hypothetical protein